MVELQDPVYEAQQFRATPKRQLRTRRRDHSSRLALYEQYNSHAALDRLAIADTRRVLRPSRIALGSPYLAPLVSPEPRAELSQTRIAAASHTLGSQMAGRAICQLCLTRLLASSRLQAFASRAWTDALS